MGQAPTAVPAGLQAAAANARWLAEHPEMWREHAGEWICIADEQLVLAEKDEHVFAEKVKPFAARGGAYILRIPAPEELEVAHPF